MPDFKDEIRKRLANLKLAPAREAELVEELAQHLEDEYEDAVARCATEDEARREVISHLADSAILARAISGNPQQAERARRPRPSALLELRS